MAFFNNIEQLLSQTTINANKGFADFGLPGGLTSGALTLAGGLFSSTTLSNNAINKAIYYASPIITSGYIGCRIFTGEFMGHHMAAPIFKGYGTYGTLMGAGLGMVDSILTYTNLIGTEFPITNYIVNFQAINSLSQTMSNYGINFIPRNHHYNFAFEASAMMMFFQTQEKPLPQTQSSEEKLINKFKVMQNNSLSELDLKELNSNNFVIPFLLESIPFLAKSFEKKVSNNKEASGAITILLMKNFAPKIKDYLKKKDWASSPKAIKSVIKSHIENDLKISETTFLSSNRTKNSYLQDEEFIQDNDLLSNWQNYLDAAIGSFSSQELPKNIKALISNLFLTLIIPEAFTILTPFNKITASTINSQASILQSLTKELDTIKKDIGKKSSYAITHAEEMKVSDAVAPYLKAIESSKHIAKELSSQTKELKANIDFQSLVYDFISIFIKFLSAGTNANAVSDYLYYDLLDKMYDSFVPTNPNTADYMNSDQAVVAANKFIELLARIEENLKKDHLANNQLQFNHKASNQISFCIDNYRLEALNPHDIEIDHLCISGTQRISVSGPSGSYKSYFFESIKGIETNRFYVEGNITFYSKNDNKMIIGMTPQYPYSPPSKTLLELITLREGHEAEKYKTKVIVLLNKYQTNSDHLKVNFLDKNIIHLSTLDKQIIALLRLALQEAKPDLILLDGIFAGLDSKSVSTVQTIITGEFSEAIVIVIDNELHYHNNTGFYTSSLKLPYVVEASSEQPLTIQGESCHLS